VNAKDKHGMTALMYAAHYNQHAEVITTLLKAGADANAKDDEGTTALNFAQTNEAVQGTEDVRR
jgi:ankyrin repeat protein